ncbi:MAG: ABC transporter permease [Candidatus Saccharibacteria bacterium]|nr:ABC transporter permease [Candidatus Saccharibacteria bacterium]
MAMLVRTHYRLAYDSIRQNKARSFLTCLGIAIGVAAIILILSLMGSIRKIISEQVAEVGENLIVVRPAMVKNEVDSIVDELTVADQYLSSNLTTKDVEVVKKISGVKAVAPISKNVLTLEAERKDDEGKNWTNRVESGLVVGTMEGMAEVGNLVLDRGAFLNDETAGLPENGQMPTAVVGRDMSLKLFGTTEAVGKIFTMKGRKFLITGVLAKVDNPVSFYNVDFDSAMMVEPKTLEDLEVNLQIQKIIVKVGTVSEVGTVSDEITKKFKEGRGGDENFSVESGEDISHPARSLFNVVTGMLTLVAGVSLVVGGIGVMNIMLVSVAERTREIGIRKAVGANGMQIVMQFLFESLILSVIGGVLGLGLGYLAAFLVSVVTPFAPYIDMDILVITLATSVGIGVLFGSYPAVKAGRKNPIESLRYYR